MCDCRIDIEKIPDMKVSHKLVIKYCPIHAAAPDLLKALEFIQSLAKSSYHRTPRTLIQICSFFDDIVLPAIEPSISQAKGEE